MNTLRKKSIWKKLKLSLITLAGAFILLAAGCATQQVTPQTEDVTLTKKSGVRIGDASFDTNFKRDEFVILGSVSGTGTVERRLVEDGDKPASEEGGGGLFGGSESSNTPAYMEYYVLDYDRTYGTWTDEGMDSVDAMKDVDGEGNIEMSSFEQRYLKHLETIAARIALYNALEEVPEADAILLPKYEFRYEMTDKFVGREKVIAREVKSVTATITGKAVRIKSDEELYETYREFPDLISNK